MTSIPTPKLTLIASWSAQKLAAAALFLLNGALLASWATEVPRIKAHLGLSELQLGFSLLAFTAGSALILPVIGGALRRYGIRAVAALAALVAALALGASSYATGLLSLSLALLTFGAGFGALDVALNNAGVLLERDAKRPFMSGLHAMYSLGALAGALFGGALIWAGLSMAAHLAILIVVSVASVFVFAPKLPQDADAPPEIEAETKGEPSQNGRVWSLPLVALGLLAACAAVPEGAVADWVGVYLRETVLAPAGVEALGFAGFSLLMLIGRLFGDRLSELWGPVRLAQVGSGVAVVGLTLALGIPAVAPVVCGFALMGLGISVLAPSAFSAVGRIAPNNTASAIAGVTAFFYIGYLSGPPVIGVLAHLGSLRQAGSLLILTCLAAALLSSILREPPSGAAELGPA